jgi:transglutaminase-like putative cysteine protease
MAAGRLRRAVLGFFVAGLLISAARAFADPTPPPLVILAAENTYDVATDGGYIQTYHFEFEPTNDASARREAQQAISYSPALEEFSIVEAHTRKADGRVIPVAAAAIHDQLPYGARDLNSFGDRRQKVIVFPDAAGGDALGYTWRRVVRHPVFPGQFMASAYMSETAPWRSLTITVRAPHAMALQTEAHGFTEERGRDGDTDVVRFHGSLAEANTRPAALGSYDRLPRVFVSSFPSYEAFAAAYAGLLAPKAVVTPDIQALADRLTAGAPTRMEAAERLYDWVSLNVRYVAVYLGTGALEPHDAATVLARGWGDCKDHTMLFHALLAAKGIKAEPVMINLGHDYTLSGPPTFAQLNHAISYLPEFGLYVDTTAGTARFGVLPFEEYGKPVVRAVAGGAVATGSVLGHTPLLGPNEATMELRTTARMTADGAISGTTATAATGPFAMDLRRRAMWAQANGPEDAAASQLRALGTEGAGAFRFPSPNRLYGGFEMGGSFALEARPDIEDGESFLPPVGLRVLVRPGDLLLGPMSLHRLADDAPTPCYRGRQIEDIVLELPPGRSLARLPHDVLIDNAALRYSAHWSINGTTLEVRRELVSKVSTAVCTGETRRLAAEALTVIRHDEQRRVGLAEPASDRAEMAP